MPETLRATWRLAQWDETPYDESDGRKLARVRATGTLSGDVSGETVWDALLAYPDPDTAHVVGIQTITGQVAGREGRIVFRTTGSFADKVARVRWEALPDCGSGELTGVEMSGGYAAGHDTYPEIYVELSPAG